MLKLLRNARKALKQWRALPATERDRYKHHADDIRSLVAELGGKRAVGYVDGASDSQDDIADGTVTARPRADVIADLQTETTSLLTALAVPATVLAKDSIPRSARIGGKIASKGLRSVARRYGDR
jgi:uncharacterized protein YbaA (DUF1428 family)